MQMFISLENEVTEKLLDHFQKTQQIYLSTAIKKINIREKMSGITEITELERLQEFKK